MQPLILTQWTRVLRDHTQKNNHQKFKVKDQTLLMKTNFSQVYICKLDKQEQQSSNDAQQFQDKSYVLKRVELTGDYQSELLEPSFQFILKHENIASIIDYQVINNQLEILMDYYPEGSIVNYLQKNQEWPWLERLKIFVNITNCVQFIHYNELIHKDLKLLNILIDSKGKPSITDFGISELQACKQIQQNKYGTAKYSGKEFQLDSNMNLDDRSDIYSIAVILVELTLQRGIYQKEVSQSVDLTKEKGLLSDDALDFLKGMIDYSSKQVRPNSQEVNSFFEYEYYASCLYQFSEKSKYPNFSIFKNKLAKDKGEMEIGLYNKIWSEKRGDIIKEILPYYLNEKTKQNFYQIQLQVITNTVESAIQLNLLSFVKSDQKLFKKTIKSFEQYKQYWGSISFMVFEILLDEQDSSKNIKLIETYQNLQYFFLKNIFSGVYSELLKTQIEFSIITMSIKMLKEQNLISDFINDVKQILEEIIDKDCEKLLIEEIEEYVANCGFYKQSDFSLLFNEELYINRSLQQQDIYLNNQSYQLSFQKPNKQNQNSRQGLQLILNMFQYISSQDNYINPEDSQQTNKENQEQENKPNGSSLKEMYDFVSQIASNQKQSYQFKSDEIFNSQYEVQSDDFLDDDGDSYDDLTLPKRKNQEN
ncbi:Serine/Threonine kinase domain protein (macronuclear) [Tetrahymena thermophila SB210]|uniref:Serine/Threonine kinase domain protein n=1 Tax=Tetrahymena thermophila (strain SB210) TaxID=312017 RepID=Q240L7_TETTS|nr:Serine/Threonine kinase domain protein [Tetrahymena thermophila SB210]EAS02191.3 Serine/Threonine kinase domain protein [Tetrahymena thermophila SB210]|eukprot:XP_001022436.3 Serine/Threonine kinase domain protein [Tetrahymena thermophila SB210]